MPFWAYFGLFWGHAVGCVSALLVRYLYVLSYLNPIHPHGKGSLMSLLEGSHHVFVLGPGDPALRYPVQDLHSGVYLGSDLAPSVGSRGTIGHRELRSAMRCPLIYTLARAY